ncbi:MAG: HlyC/CorC family transporter [Deltaproteobacteria bacterium]|nr:HlyC/CorC family transporter [Deltaproteobacteria bacterium]
MIMQFFLAEAGSLAVIVGCLVLSAFFSAAETAITSLGVIKVRHILEQKGKRASPLNLWLQHPGRVIATILLFNNVVNILASSVTTRLAYIYFESGAVGIATGFTTFWVLVFGEIIPKSFAKSHAEGMALVSMRIIQMVYLISYPLVRALSDFADLVIRFISGGSKTKPLITEEEIEFIVSEGEKAGVIGDIKKDIIEGAFDFDETKVREIMTPRPDLTALPVETPWREVVEKVIETGHSRIPVYKDNIDQIVGLVLAKDLLKFLNHENQGMENLTASDFMREVHFVPESRSIMEEFKDLNILKIHMAIVVNEYGSTIGVVTMEDILEQIVGEIQDEFDAEEALILKIDDNVYEVSGAINIDEFFQYFDIGEDQLKENEKGEDIDTLAGWVTQLIGQVPEVGQQVRILNFLIEVIRVSQRRLQVVRVQTLPPELELKKDDGQVNSDQQVPASELNS